MASTSTSRIDGLTTSLAVKAPVKVVAVDPITLSGLQTVNGTAVVARDRVLVTAQADPIYNGIYTVKAGEWLRAGDFDGARDVAKGTVVWAANPGVNGSFWQVSSDDPHVIGIDPVSFTQNYHLSSDTVALSNTDITVNVGTGGAYSTINGALTYLSGLKQAHNTDGGIMATIMLLTGFEMEEQVILNGSNFGWVTIRSVDATVPCVRSALVVPTADFVFEEDAQFGARMPAFFAYNGAVMPRIGCLFSMNQTGPDENYAGIILHGSHCTVLAGAGFTNVVKPDGHDGRGVNATHGSTLAAWGSVWSGCQIAVRVSNSSKGGVRGCTIVGAQLGIDVNGCSEVSAQDSTITGMVGISNVHAIWASSGSTVKATDCDLTDCAIGNATESEFATVLSEGGSKVDITGSDVSGGQRGVEANSGGSIVWDLGVCTEMDGLVIGAKDGGVVTCNDASITGCASEGAVIAFEGGTVIGSRMEVTNNTAVSGLYAYGGIIRAPDSTITGNKNTLGDYDIRIRDGGEVDAWAAVTTNGGGTTIALQDVSIGVANVRTRQGLLIADLDPMVVRSKEITIDSPTSSEDESWWFQFQAATITEISAVLAGSSVPSVTWTVRHGTDRAATGTEAITGGTITNSTTPVSITAFDAASIAAGSYVWIETTAQSGTVVSLSLRIKYREVASF